MTDRATDREILERAIGASGLSARRFAMDVLARDERTVRRWLQPDDAPGARPMPEAVRAFLTRYLREHTT